MTLEPYPYLTADQLEELALQKQGEERQSIMNMVPRRRMGERIDATMRTVRDEMKAEEEAKAKTAAEAD